MVAEVTGLEGLIATLLVFFIIFIFIGIAVYIYFALALMKVAKRTQTQPAWLAWIPIANFYLVSKVAKMHWWPIILIIISSILFQFENTIISTIGMISWLIFAIFTIIWTWKICEIRNKPGWWAIITIIPLIGWIWWFIMWGILAWGE